MVCYDYNSAWNSLFPFYDDKNKTPISKESNAKTYSELINECDKILDININDKIFLAKDRFCELVGKAKLKLKKLKNYILYEIKYSKTANLNTIYKFYNFYISDIDNKEILLNPKKLNCKLISLNDKNFSNLISNAKYIIDNENLIDYSFKI